MILLKILCSRISNPMIFLLRAGQKDDICGLCFNERGGGESVIARDKKESREDKGDSQW